MKGHKFDWRVKRRPAGGYYWVNDPGTPVASATLRWVPRRYRDRKRNPTVRWLGKRGTQRFVARHRSLQ